MLFLLLLLSLFTSCSSSSKEESSWHYFAARNPSKESLYKARVPLHWKRIDPVDESYLIDTTLPFCAFEIENGVHLSIHSFPKEPAISPFAQIQRWERQFQKINGVNPSIEKISHNGFSGLFFEAEGQWKDKKEVKVLAWSLVVDPFICQMLKNKELTAALTFKAIGPIDAVEAQRSQIVQFVESFEFLKEHPFLR